MREGGWSWEIRNSQEPKVLGMCFLPTFFLKQSWEMISMDGCSCWPGIYGSCRSSVTTLDLCRKEAQTKRNGIVSFDWHCLIAETGIRRMIIYIYMIISLQALYLSMFIYFILSQHMRHMRSYEHVRDLDQPKIHSSMCSAPPWTSVLTEAILTLPDVSMVRVPNWNASRSRHGYR